MPVVKLYLDSDVDPLVVRRLRARSYDVISAHEIGRSRVPDDEQLAYAAREARALLTFNIEHFVRLYDQWWHAGRSHAGIIVSRQYQRAEIGELLRLVENLLQVATEEDLTDRLRFLSEFDV